MNKFLTLLALSLIGAQSNAAPIHNISRFSVDWKTPSLSDGLGCPGTENVVIMTVPGTVGKDFTVDGPGDPCILVLSQGGIEENGADSTTLVYKGQCSSDGEQNFSVTQVNGEKKQVAVTVDSGC